MTGRLFAAWVWYAGLWLFIGAVRLFVDTGYAAGAAVAAVLLPVVSLGGALWARRGLAVSLEMPTFAAKGRELRGRVVVVNRGALPMPRVFCRVTVRNALTGAEDRQTVTLSAAARSEAGEWVSLHSVYCGGVRVRVERVWVADMLGLIPLPVHAGARTWLTVLPDSFAARTSVPPLAPEALDGEFYRADRPGPDASEPFQLRPYRLGDDVRRIHWKLSSKLDEIIARDGSEPVARRLLLFWDKTTAPSGVAMDTLAEAIVSVARALVESGVGCTLGWTAPDGAVFEPIDGVQALLDAMPMLLRGGGETAELPRFARGDYGCVLYFAAAKPPEIEDQTQLLLYSRTPCDGALCFDETNCADVLRRLELS